MVREASRLAPRDRTLFLNDAPVDVARALLSRAGVERFSCTVAGAALLLAFWLVCGRRPATARR